MPGDSGATVVTNARATTFYTRGCGCIGHPAFPTPSGADELANLGQIMSREREGVMCRSPDERSDIRDLQQPRISLRSCGLRVRTKRLRPAERLQHALLRFRRFGVVGKFRLILERL